MRITIDLTVCQNLAQCAFTAPDLFPLRDDGKLAFRDITSGVYEGNDLAPEDEELALEAEALCPTQAIKIKR